MTPSNGNGSTHSNGAARYQQEKVRVAIVGVGNCASAFVQGIEYYRNADASVDVPGLMHVDLGGYHISDVEFTAAFDIDADKVGKDLGEAIWAGQNNTIKFAEVPKKLGVQVHRGMTHDGLGKYLKEKITKAPGETADIVGILKDTHTDVVVSYLPVGSEQATKWYVEQVLEAGCGFVNCIPVFIAREDYWDKRFKKAGLPIVGDDIKSQVGATIVHRNLARLFHDRGVKLMRTSQLNVGGNMDFYNMLERERLESKKISKTNAVTSIMGHELPAGDVHVGPSDYVPWLTDRKWAHIRLEGQAFGDVPLTAELKLEVWDSPNSAGIVIDAVRCCKLALNHGISGQLDGPSSYLMKSPHNQRPDDAGARGHRGVHRHVHPPAGQRARRDGQAGDEGLIGVWRVAPAAQHRRTRPGALRRQRRICGMSTDDVSTKPAAQTAKPTTVAAPGPDDRDARARRRDPLSRRRDALARGRRLEAHLLPRARPRRPGDRQGPHRRSASRPATASRSSPTRAPSGRWPTSARSAPAPPWCPSTRPTRRRSASTSSTTAARSRSSARTAGSSPSSRRSATRCPKLEHVFRFEGEGDDAMTLDELRAAGADVSEDDLDARVAAIGSDDIATIVYTSGTTGPAEGLHAHARQPLRGHRRHPPAAEDHARRRRRSTSSCRSPTCSRGSCSSSRSTPAARWRTGAATRRRSSRTCSSSGRRTCRRCRASSRRSTRRDRQGRRGRRGEGEDLPLGGRRRPRGRPARGPRRPSRARAQGPARARRQARPAQDPRPLRRPREARAERRGADRHRDPRVLPRRRHLGARGLRHDRDLRGRDAQHDRAPSLRHRRPAAARLRGEDRRRRRGAHARPEHLQGLLQQPGGDGARR